MNKRFPIILGFLLLAFAVWLQVTNVRMVQLGLNRLKNIVYDFQLRTHLLITDQLKTSIVIVDVDDRSLAKEGRWPWSREKIGLLVDKLKADGAAVVAFDMLFSGKEDNIAELIYQKMKIDKSKNNQEILAFKKIIPEYNADAQFGKSLSGIDNVLSISFQLRPGKEGILPDPFLTLSEAEQQIDFIQAYGVIGVSPSIMDHITAGFINVFPDEDGVIRRVPLVIRYNNQLYPSLALEAVRTYLFSKIGIITAFYGKELGLEAVSMGSRRIPTDSKGQVIVPFRGKAFTFPYISASRVLHDQVPPGFFAGKIVFVGTSATGLGDIKSTAIQNVFPGVEVQATIADGILKNNFAYKPGWLLGGEVIFIIIFGTMLIFLFAYSGARLLGFYIILIPFLLIILNNILWTRANLVVTISIPFVFTILLAIINISYGFFFETLRREKLKEMFGQYVPEKHIDKMLSSKGNYGLLGENRRMTVLFADIRHFTSISETMNAAQLKELLNAFFTPMTEVIFKYRGTIDKYVGDLIMAFWGAPLKDKYHAEHALAAALDMQEAVIKLRPLFKLNNWPDIEIGIGVNSGTMSVGDMGSRFRRNYTVLGDAVNLASRVESLTKRYGVKIITTRNTYKLAHNKFIFRLLDRVQVKGKSRSIFLYELVCRPMALTEELKKEIADSELGLHYYFTKQWEKSREIFSTLKKHYPMTKIYRLYLYRLTEFTYNPPPENWDGTYTYKNK